MNIEEKGQTKEGPPVLSKKRANLIRGDYSKSNNLKKNEEGVKIGISDQGLEKAKSYQNLSEIEKKIVTSIENVMRKMATNGVSPAHTQKKERGQIYFISGFDYLGLSPEKNNGILQMSKTVSDSKHYFWNDKDKIIQDIKKRPHDVPIILVGHSLGGDSAVEIANDLNKLENHFRKVDLLVTLDSVGFNNKIIPENVNKNINYFGENGLLFNGSPNAARDNDKSLVINKLKDEPHAELDNSDTIQREILDNIQVELKKALKEQNVINPS